MVKISKAVLNDVKKRSKYNAQRTQCLYKHLHDSAKEALWCVKLHQMQQEGKIKNLLRETPYDLRVNGILVAVHMPDFDYDIMRDGKWCPEVLDVKGMKIAVWILKHKMFLACYPDINYVVV